MSIQEWSENLESLVVFWGQIVMPQWPMSYKMEGKNYLKPVLALASSVFWEGQHNSYQWGQDYWDCFPPAIPNGGWKVWGLKQMLRAVQMLWVLPESSLGAETVESEIFCKNGRIFFLSN